MAKVSKSGSTRKKTKSGAKPTKAPSKKGATKAVTKPAVKKKRPGPEKPKRLARAPRVRAQASPRAPVAAPALAPVEVAPLPIAAIEAPAPIAPLQPPLPADPAPSLATPDTAAVPVVVPAPPAPTAESNEPPATEHEVAGAAFWASPDPPALPAIAAPRASEPGTPMLPENNRPFEGGRRRRRRRRHRGSVDLVPTERPIDSPEMASIVTRLRRQFGLHSFRPGQERIIRNVLARRDTLAVMPTGSGKSLTFQLPAMVLPGVTVVVSPLLALMKDQTDKLRRRGVVAARLDSTLSTADERHTLQMIEENQRKLIYVTPERAGSSDFKGELGGQPVSLFVIDEAHCVSQWGHDFRPAYLNLRRVVQELGHPPVLALTATATPRVVEDIKERLGTLEAEVIHTGFQRPELIFEVRSTPDEKAQVKRLLRLVRRIKGSGIIYCSTIHNVDALAGALPRLGLRVGKYHGKMTKLERDSEQHRFMRNQVRVMIATNAFGLGVDKPDIRFVIHYNLPGSVEQYYQEAGRAGRDGKPARCILLWRPGDEEVQEHFVAQKYPGRDQVRGITQAFLAGPGKISDIALRAGVPQKKAQVVIAMLEEAELVRVLPGDVYAMKAPENTARVARGKGEAHSAVPSEGEREGSPHIDEQVIWNAAEAYRKKRESDRERLKVMLDYAEARRCRVQLLLDYFGEQVPPCTRCDNCTGRNTAVHEEEEDLADEDRPHIEIPEAPPPPRKDPTTMF